MDAGGKKLRDGDVADLKSDAIEMERASNLVQHDIEKIKNLIEDNGESPMIFHTISIIRVCFYLVTMTL